MNYKQLFVLTKDNANTQSDDFLLLLKVLETLATTVKVDTRLPEVGEREHIALFLVDAAYCDCQEMLSEVIIQLARQHSVAVFNAQRHALNERTALLANLKGALYNDDSPEHMFKGVRRVLGGELWFCRKAISNAFGDLIQQLPATDALSAQRHSDIDLSVLTAREKSVISLLAKGAKNDDIACALNISNHTVKTHIYSAFRKTNSRNRIELANWAQRYIPVASRVMEQRQ